MTHDLVLEAAPLTLHCEVRTVWFAVLAENFNAPWNEEICRGPGDGASLKRYIFLNRGIYRCQCPCGLSRWQNIKCFDQKTVACSVMMMMMIEK